MASSIKAQLVIMLGWFTTQRIGCLRQLDKQDIMIHGSTMSVRFRRGKVVWIKDNIRPGANSSWHILGHICFFGQVVGIPNMLLSPSNMSK